MGSSVSPGWSQSRRQPPTSNEKKNKRPGETPKPGDQQDPLPPDIVPTKPQDIEKLSITTQIVNVDAVVYHKKSGQIVTNLKKAKLRHLCGRHAADDHKLLNTRSADHGGDGGRVQQVVGILWAMRRRRGYEPGTYEVIRPTAMFLSQFIKPPDDYVSVVAFDIRPTPLTDFTNDPGRLAASD